MKAAILMTCVLWFAMLVGCASSRPIAPGMPALSFEPGAESPVAEALTPAIELAAARAGERRWFVIEGEHAGKTIIESWSDDAGTLTMTRRLEGGADLLEAQTYRPDEPRGAVLERSINHERGVIVEFTPKLVSMPRTLAPGEPAKQAMRLRLPLVNNPKRLREEGTASRELTLLGMQTVRIGGEEFRAWHVREVMTNDLKAARAVRTTDRWLTAEAGAIAERYEEEVKALGITVEKTRRVMVLTTPRGPES